MLPLTCIPTHMLYNNVLNHITIKHYCENCTDVPNIYWLKNDILQKQSKCIDPIQIKLYPSGFLSAIHGIIKPFYYSLKTKRTLLTPLIPEYTSSQCGQHDLSCFFQNMSKHCKKSTKISVRNKKIVNSYNRISFRDVAHILKYIMQPNGKLMSSIITMGKKTGLDIALLKSHVIGMHVRHGDSCLKSERHRTKRNCSDLVEYMKKAYELSPDVKTIYLATDSKDVIMDTKKFPDYTFLYLKNVQRYKKKHPPPFLDNIIRKRTRKNETYKTMEQTEKTIIDLWLLAQCNIFVGKFTSNFFRAAYSLSTAFCDCAKPYVSLDSPWCFNYGSTSTTNFEC